MAYFTGAARAAALLVVYRFHFAAAVALLIIGAPAAAFASAPAADSGLLGRTITGIWLQGLQKTQEEVVYDLLDVEVGDPVTANLFRSIEESLLDSDLFVTVQVSGHPNSNDAVELVIVLDEKWTLVPVPFFTTNGDNYQGGLIVLETNLLGRNKQLISAGFLGTDGVRAFVAYVDPAVFGSSWTTSVSAAVGRNETERIRPDGTRLRLYEYDQQRVGFNLGYNVTRQIEVNAGLGFERWEFISEEDLEDTQLVESRLGARYDGTRPLDVLRVGPRARIGGRFVSYQEGWEIGARAEWGIPIAETHRFRIVGSGAIGAMPTVTEQVISGRDGYRTLPYMTVSADSWGSGSFIYDLPVLSADWGALVLSHFWELGSYTNDDVDPRLFYGPGGGFRVYIRQVAIPALGLDVAYNIPDDEVVFSFSLGAQM